MLTRKHLISNSEGNLPSEELLELGINYLNQAINSWEIALDSIESASYMKSKLPALPVSSFGLIFRLSVYSNTKGTLVFRFVLVQTKSNEHANLVFKLRTLLDRANEVNQNCTQKLSNGSRTLQIIQSRLQHKQQQYTAALLNVDDNSINYLSDEHDDDNNDINQMVTAMDEDDTETYVSATSVRLYTVLIFYFSRFKYSDFLQKAGDYQMLSDDLNYLTLYDIGLQEANMNRITCRVLRFFFLSPVQNVNPFQQQNNLLLQSTGQKCLSVPMTRIFLPNSMQYVSVLIGLLTINRKESGS